MKMRDVETAFRQRRIPYPKRSVELIALLAISCTFFLFMHTNKLNSRLKEMQMKLQPSEFSALSLTAVGAGLNGGGAGAASSSSTGIDGSNHIATNLIQSSTPTPTTARGENAMKQRLLNNW